MVRTVETVEKRRRRRRRRGRLGSMQMENKFVRRADNLLTRYLLMCAFMQMADEIIVCVVCEPTPCMGTWLGFTGTAPPGTRQTEADGETADQKRLRAAAGLKPFSRSCVSISFLHISPFLHCI